VVLTWAEHEAFGGVVWVREGFCGIQLEGPLQASVLVAARHLQDTRGLKRDEMADWIAEKGWAFGKALS
jgi:hypothetical protein